jgi:xanthine dehydrogenase large subunit
LRSYFRMKKSNAGMVNPDAASHVIGRSLYVDDINVQHGTLAGLVFASPLAHGRIRKLDLDEARKVPEVIAVFSAGDVPGENQIGGIVPDEPLFAEGEVHFHGQPVALIVATDEFSARKARKLIRFEADELDPVTDPRLAKEKGLLLVPPQTHRMGDPESAWKNCAHIFEGCSESGGQEHLYIETQGSYAYPTESGGIKIHSSTQGPSLVQKIAARVLGVSMHRVEVDVTRLGGGFGGKEDQATAYACMAALAAMKLNKPVKVILHRMDDMMMTGKRHPYSADFRIGLSSDLKILAYTATFYQNGGAAADLSPAILDRSLFHLGNAYYIPNTEVTAYSCKTNLPPNTAFRGFGGPQGMFVIEAAIAKAAHHLKIPARKIQEANFLKENDAFPYGQVAKNVHIGSCAAEAWDKFRIMELEEAVAAHNQKNDHTKKGLACMPVCFGISFTNTSMNQARALVHIFQDGSIEVSTGAVEMGQGVNAKIRQVAAGLFSVGQDRVRLATTNTSRVANTSPTAASSGADLNGKATGIACNALKKRLLDVAADILAEESPEAVTAPLELRDEWVWAAGKRTGLSWDELVTKALLKRVCLSENGHYATPGIHFDKATAKGNPFAYHVYGIACLEVTLDCIRGTYRFDQALIVHDFGNSINPLIDLGQVEGALVQGLGWMTMEEVVYGPDGRLLSNSLSTYKVPDIYSVPQVVKVIPLDVVGPDAAIMKSKAVGEPPLMYGIGGFFALQNAILAFNPNYEPDFDAPMTPEKVLLRLYRGRSPK